MSKLWSERAQRAEPYTAGEQRIPEGSIKLNTNENPYPPSAAVFEAIQEKLTEYLREYPDSESMRLRQAIAELHNVSTDQVFVGNGSDEVLAFSFMAFFNPDEKIRFPEITYSFYPAYAKLFSIPYEQIALQEDFTLNEAGFYQSEGGVIFPNPNAPTGILLSLQAIERILKENDQRPVIIDEAYIDFGGETAIALLEKYDQLLVTRTFSKSRALAGMRIGYAVGSAHMIEALDRIKNSINSYTLDQIAQTAGVAAVKDEAYFQKTVEMIIRTRDRFKTMLESLSFTVLPSSANFLFVSHPRVPAEELYHSLKTDGIFVRHFQQPEIADWLRISIGTDEDMQYLFERLSAIISCWTETSQDE